MSKIQVVVGGQFGSEAKGHVTRQLIDAVSTRNVINVRVAGPNAGHTAYDDQGRKWPLRTVPVGATSTAKGITLYIAPGSEIDKAVLFRELHELNNAGLNASNRLFVSPEATILTEQHINTETGMHERIGSTGKGIGACRADRIMRTAKRVIDDAEFYSDLQSLGVTIGSPDLYAEDTTVIIEGTQGYGLGLHAGHYPRCTSSDTRAIDFLAMAGVMPWHPNVDGFEVWVVARVYPIRVAGNSGRLENETTWDRLGLPEERTTVTNKVRRVGMWDPALVREAVAANGGAPHVRLALTMLDQKFGFMAEQYGDLNIDILPTLTMDEEEALLGYLSGIEADAKAPVHMITTSPVHAIWSEGR